jgi:hypothetical protein
LAMATKRKRGRALVVLAAWLGAGCSGPAQQVSGSKPQPPASQPAPAPRDPDCGPEIEGQSDPVRTAVLEALIRQSLQEAAAAGTPHGEIVIWQEQRLPGGQVFVRDASPGVTAHFANHTPPVGGYSSGFSVQGGRTERKKGLVAFTTGEIFWKSGGEAVVKARTIGEDRNTPWSATVQRTGADWLVKSIEARR